MNDNYGLFHIMKSKDWRLALTSLHRFIINAKILSLLELVHQLYSNK